MANWVTQDFHVHGKPADLQRFRRALLAPVRSGSRRLSDGVLYVARMFPDADPDATSEEAVCVDWCQRSRCQLNYAFQTKFAYHDPFFRELAANWPELSFVVAVNDEMGTFGGIILGLDGRLEELVEDYNTAYNRRSHAQRCRHALRRWFARLREGRDWMVGGSVQPTPDLDATFNDEGRLFFRSAEACWAYMDALPPGQRALVMRRTADDRWVRARRARTRAASGA
jgi:hypothetical protein